jgi:hypothetical protein
MSSTSILRDRHICLFLPHSFLYRINKAPHLFGVGVGINAVTQVGSVSVRAEGFQHFTGFLTNLIERGVQYAGVRVAFPFLNLTICFVRERPGQKTFYSL